MPANLLIRQYLSDDPQADSVQAATGTNVQLFFTSHSRGAPPWLPITGAFRSRLFTGYKARPKNYNQDNTVKTYGRSATRVTNCRTARLLATKVRRKVCVGTW